MQANYLTLLKFNSNLKSYQTSKKVLFVFFFTIIFNAVTYAQLNVTGQIRTRTEIRQGQGTLSQQGDVPALFTSQRTRLNIGYSGYRYKFFTAIQDVRVWGQDASTINRTSNDGTDGFLVHEAWAEIMLTDTINKSENLTLKFGRQAINYDDQRLLGGLDWLQQGRRHDAAILKYTHKSWIADIGVAFNQNSERNNNTVYNGTPIIKADGTATYPAGTNGIGTLYKSFQFLYLGKKLKFGEASLLYFGDNFSQYTTSGTPALKTYESSIWSRNTIGIYLNANLTKSINLNGSLYHQGGHDKDGRSIDAKMGSIALTYKATKKLSLSPGIDYLSGDNGNDAVTPTSDTKRFDPLYGTPHKFWGYMDYFYVANGFGRNGLVNYFMKAKYVPKESLVLTLDVHGFESAGTLKDNLTAYLGTEIDFTAKYNLTNVVGLEFGYSYLKATETMASSQVKNVANFNENAHWAYLMINITPNFLTKK
jgi:hypothetical protein